MSRGDGRRPEGIGTGEYGHASAHPEPSPGDSQGELPRRGKRGWPGPLVSFPSLGKKLAARTAPAGAFRSATAAQRRLLARRWRNPALPPGWRPHRQTKELYHRPLIRPSVRTGAPSPQGEGLGKTKRDRSGTCLLKHGGEAELRRKFFWFLFFQEKELLTFFFKESRQLGKVLYEMQENFAEISTFLTGGTVAKAGRLW